MPERTIRQGILSSETINKLSLGAEVFYRRLMSVADDYGRYDGRPAILRSALYPLRVDETPVSQIEAWLKECKDAGAVNVYLVDGKPFVEIFKFEQRLRAKTSKWPTPQALVGALLTSAGECPHVADVCCQIPPKAGTETEANSSTEAGGGNYPPLSVALQYFSSPKEGMPTFTRDEITAVYLSFLATVHNNQWYVGARPVGDWRASMGSRLLDRRNNRRAATEEKNERRSAARRGPNI